MRIFKTSVVALTTRFLLCQLPMLAALEANVMAVVTVPNVPKVVLDGIEKLDPSKLEKNLKDKNPEVRLDAVLKISYLFDKSKREGSRSDPPYHILAPLLNDRDEKVRAAAIKALQGTENVLAKVEDYLHSIYPETRLFTVENLGYEFDKSKREVSGSDRPYHILAPLLNDRDEKVRAAAIKALRGNVKKQDLMPYANSFYPEVRAFVQSQK